MTRRLTLLAATTAVVLSVLIAGAAPASAASILYGATGSNAVGGRLYILNPVDGSVITDIGALMTVSGAPVGLTGLAFHPTTGVLYGSTANNSPTFGDGRLVIVDPATAIVTSVGLYGADVTGSVTDLAFTAAGDLFGWESAGGHQLVSIDLATGAATAIGAGLGTSVFGGGALEFDAGGTLYVTPDGASPTATAPTLRSVDTTTGLTTTIGNLTPNPFFGSRPTINAMSFDPAAGLMFGVFTNRAGTALTRLLTIDLNTGALSDRGASVNNLDAIAFQPQQVPEPGTLTFAAAAAAFAAVRRRTRR